MPALPALPVAPLSGTLASIALTTAARAQTAAAPDPSDIYVWGVLTGVILVPVLLLIVRKQWIVQLGRQMMVVSTAQSAIVIPALAAPEQAAHSVPQFIVHNADQADAATMAPRHQRELGVARLYRRVFLANLSFALAFALLPLLFGRFVWSGAVVAGSVLAILLGLFAILQHVIHRRQYRAYDLTRSRGRQRLYDRLGCLASIVLVPLSIATGAALVNLRNAPEILRALTSPPVRAVVLGVTALTVAGAWDGSGGAIGLAVALLFQIAVLVWLVRTGRRVPGLHLLVLRVFNNIEASTFTFSGLTNYWRYFGNHFTVVDGSLVRQDQKEGIWRTLLTLALWYLALIVAVAVAANLLHMASAVGFALLVAALACLGAWIAYRIGTRHLGRGFIESRDELIAKLRQIERKPRHIDLSFRQLHAKCRDNTWFIAVAEFVKRADAVLMDLRGYSDARKGCQTEVDFLFDAVPADRVLFLVDLATDVAAVEAMLLERWAELRSTSPNLLTPEPRVHIYGCVGNDERDMQAILDLLIVGADRSANLDAAPPHP